MIDIYNEKLAKYADGERRIFTATFLRPDDRKGIFQNFLQNVNHYYREKKSILNITPKDWPFGSFSLIAC